MFFIKWSESLNLIFLSSSRVNNFVNEFGNSDLCSEFLNIATQFTYSRWRFKNQIVAIAPSYKKHNFGRHMTIILNLWFYILGWPLSWLLSIHNLFILSSVVPLSPPSFIVYESYKFVLYEPHIYWVESKLTKNSANTAFKVQLNWEFSHRPPPYIYIKLVNKS